MESAPALSYNTAMRSCAARGLLFAGLLLVAPPVRAERPAWDQPVEGVSTLAWVYVAGEKRTDPQTWETLVREERMARLQRFAGAAQAKEVELHALFRDAESATDPVILERVERRLHGLETWLEKMESRSEWAARWVDWVQRSREEVEFRLAPASGAGRLWDRAARTAKAAFRTRIGTHTRTAGARRAEVIRGGARVALLSKTVDGPLDLSKVARKEEKRLAGLLKGLGGFEDAVARLRKAGYEVLPAPPP